MNSTNSVSYANVNEEERGFEKSKEKNTDLDPVGLNANGRDCQLSVP